MIEYLYKKNEQLRNELVKEKQRRDEELSLIIKSLIYMESKINVDKKLINELLFKKDMEIRRLVSINRILKGKLIEQNVTDTKENWTQTMKDEQLLNDSSGHIYPSNDSVSSSFNGSHLVKDDTFNFDTSTKKIITIRHADDQKNSKLKHFCCLSRNRPYATENEEHDVLSLVKENQTFRSSNQLSINENKCEFELSTNNWYACDGEEDLFVETNLYDSYSVINPVLECVNQILFKESNDDSELLPSNRFNKTILGNSEGQKRKNKNKKDNETTLPEQFVKNNATLLKTESNAHEQDNPLFPLTLASKNKSEIIEEKTNETTDSFPNYESLYSNEYEPIGNEDSSHLYVDMEVALDIKNRISLKHKLPSEPPALPQKPPNLKKINNKDQQSIKSEKSFVFNDESILLEPDYCSISEVNTTLSNVQIARDNIKMKMLSNETASRKSNYIEEISSHIPKFSKASKIMGPKTPIANINIVKSFRTGMVSKAQFSPCKIQRKPVSNISAEINKQMSTALTKKTSATRTNIIKKSVHSNKMEFPTGKFQLHANFIMQEEYRPIQSEFDWYNLDMEYGKSSNLSNSLRIFDESSEFLGVQYNLDKEFVKENKD